MQRSATSANEETEDHHEESPHWRGYAHVRPLAVRIHRRILRHRTERKNDAADNEVRIPEEVKISHF